MVYLGVIPCLICLSQPQVFSRVHFSPPLSPARGDFGALLEAAAGLEAHRPCGGGRLPIELGLSFFGYLGFWLVSKGKPKEFVGGFQRENQRKPQFLEGPLRKIDSLFGPTGHH